MLTVPKLLLQSSAGNRAVRSMPTSTKAPWGSRLPERSVTPDAGLAAPAKPLRSGSATQLPELVPVDRHVDAELKVRSAPPALTNRSRRSPVVRSGTGPNRFRFWLNSTKKPAVPVTAARGAGAAGARALGDGAQAVLDTVVVAAVAVAALAARAGAPPAGGGGGRPPPALRPAAARPRGPPPHPSGRGPVLTSFFLG